MEPAPQYVRKRLRGVAVGLLTPFDADGETRHEKLAENARALYDVGARTFLAASNISEYHSLSKNERVAVARRGSPVATATAGESGRTDAGHYLCVSTTRYTSITISI